MNRLLLILTHLSFVFVKTSAQSVEANYETLDYGYDSAGSAGNPSRPVEKVALPGAPWLRLHLDGTYLPPGSTLRLTSALDGAEQFFHDQSSLTDYRHTSAFFNGDEVVVELLLGPNAQGYRRVKIPQVDVGLGPPITPESLCGGDDRVLSDDPRQGRQNPAGCTTFLISVSVVLTAGHCTTNPSQSIHMNVPMSSATGALRFPPPEDQYPYDTSTLQRLDEGVGKDWAVARTVRNSNTNQYPGEANGSQWYSLGIVPGSETGQTIRITGYGVVSDPVDPT